MTHRVETVELAAPAPGSARRLLVHRFGAGKGPKAYIQCAIHAGEIPALLVGHHLLARLERAEVTGEVVLVPAANPIGLAQRLHRQHLGRYDLDSGGNFNRGFPDLAEAIDEAVAARLSDDEPANVGLIRRALRRTLDGLHLAQEAPFLKRTLLRLACDADIVLDLHCAQRALLHLFMNEAFWPDGADLHAELGSQTTLLEAETGSGLAFDHACTVVWRTLQARHPDRPIPLACFSATVELRGFADVDDDVAAADADALMRFLIRRGVVAGEPGPLPESLCDPVPLDGVGFATAPATGVVVFKVALGDHVRRGQTIAWIVDPMAPASAEARQPVTSPTEGTVYELADRRMVWQGQHVALVAGVEPVPGQRENLLIDR